MRLLDPYVRALHELGLGKTLTVHGTAAAVQVVEILADSLTLPETPVPSKVARLMLVSDVLHNSTASVRNASRYRSLLEAALPDVFESLQVWIQHHCMMAISPRMS